MRRGADIKVARAELTDIGMDVVKNLTTYLSRRMWEPDHGSIQQALREERFRWIKRFVNPHVDVSGFDRMWEEMGDYRRGQFAAKYGVRVESSNAKSLVFSAMQRAFESEKKLAEKEAYDAERVVSSAIPGGDRMVSIIPGEDSWMFVLRVSNMIMRYASGRSADSLIGPMSAEDVDAEAGPKVGPPEQAQPLRSRRDYGCVSCRKAEKASEGWVTRAQVAEICPLCAEKMAKAGIDRVRESRLKEAMTLAKKDVDRAAKISAKVAAVFEDLPWQVIESVKNSYGHLLREQVVAQFATEHEARRGAAILAQKQEKEFGWTPSGSKALGLSEFRVNKVSRIATRVVKAYTDTELRSMYGELESSRDKGIGGLMTLLTSIWRLDNTDWRAVRAELLKYPSGAGVVRGMEALPRFKDIADGGYNKVRAETGSSFGRHSPEFDRLVKEWEAFERNVLRDVEQDMVNYYMARK